MRLLHYLSKGRTEFSAFMPDKKLVIIKTKDSIFNKKVWKETGRGINKDRRKYVPL